MTEAIPGNAGRADYPRMVYHPDGRTRQVETAAEENALLPDGWGQKPSAVHTRPKPSPSMAFGGSDPLAVLIRNILEQVLDERGVGRSPRAKDEAPAPELPLRSHHKKS